MLQGPLAEHSLTTLHPACWQIHFKLYMTTVLHNKMYLCCTGGGGGFYIFSQLVATNTVVIMTDTCISCLSLDIGEDWCCYKFALSVMLKF